ncbi:uncharacterized protein AB675_8508 [Cyphellophora attinorum]|uniref:BTB domain-containing protein n=1 Tax=Cyphellophora attinorum TaxID=1664694 RepID=A0A0N1P190_9EURO|nr:uncharacterized protein AB675_8508 [Phialophora attinorum]KPI44467.1 hypothetical protein AB675_8508 [Phialophora attinorum]
MFMERSSLLNPVIRITAKASLSEESYHLKVSRICQSPSVDRGVSLVSVLMVTVFLDLVLNKNMPEMEIAALEKARIERVAAIEAASRTPANKFTSLNAPNTGLVDLLKSGGLSDFKICCGERVFQVHRSQIYARSDYFKSIIDGGFQESAESSVTLEDTTPLAVATLLLIMYAGQPGLYLDEVYKVWPDLKPEASSTDSQDSKDATQEHFSAELRNLVDVYILADRLMINDFQGALAKHIVNHIDYDYFVTGEEVLETHTAPLLEYIFSNTATEHTLLRQEVTVLCMRKRFHISESLGNVLESHDPYGWRLSGRICAMVKEQHHMFVTEDWEDAWKRSGWPDAANFRHDWSRFLDTTLWKSFGMEEQS